jgi:hypothetical protein
MFAPVDPGLTSYWGEFMELFFLKKIPRWCSPGEGYFLEKKLWGSSPNGSSFFILNVFDSQCNFFLCYRVVQ